MSLLGVVAILLSFAGLYFASVRPSQERTLFAICLILLHIAASVAYYIYAQSNWVDARGYYFDPSRLGTWDFEFGTVFLVKTVALLKGIVGGTYLDYFLLFQVFGAWGIILLFRTFQEVHQEFGQHPTTISYLMLLLPGLHFWTSALGKDAPILFAASLAVWAVMRLSRRLIPLAVALGIMVLIRPHIALVVIVALALSTAFERRSTGLARIGLLVIAVAGASYVAATVKRTIKIDVTSANSITDFLATQHDVSQTVAGGTNIGDTNYVFRLFSLLFQPLFVDANGLMGLVASFENLFLLFVFAFLFRKYRAVLWLVRRVYFLRFTLFFALTLIVLLSLIQYNVGLGLRQKVMVYPALFAFFISIWAATRARPSETGPVPARPHSGPLNETGPSTA